ncbi:MAG TPA: amidohydrolase family protein [Pirellulales bacterium]|jgi:predicted TIM-barrel fold metal-dependent hydrolase
MRNLLSYSLVSALAMLFLGATPAAADDVKKTPLYARLKAGVDAVPAIDTHDHLRPFDQLPNQDETDHGRGMTLHSIWAGGYYPGLNKLSPWPAGKSFDAWWSTARNDFDNARATSFYRYLLPGFRDLYGVDFDTITDAQARELNDRIFANYKDDKWLIDVVTRRANIELMLIDPYWARLQFARAYQFAVPVLNVSMLISGHHADKFANPLDSPYVFAERKGRKIESLDDYLEVLDKLFEEAVAADVACLKSTQAYQRTLTYDRVPKERAAAIFGKTSDKIKPEELKAFEDFMFWHIVKLSAKYDLPFQIHTGQARIQGSNPMLLVDLIEANPKTKFILFHGGYPWIGETAVIGMKYRNVWIDSVWLPTLSYTMAKRAYQEWLESMPSDRILWGADTVQAEGIYAATEFTRQCLTEALAEKVERGELIEKHAAHIGRQIMRENALALFPKLRRQLWRTDARAKPEPEANSK